VPRSSERSKYPAAQQEELQLGTGVQDIPQLLGPIELPAQDPARVTRERVAIRGEDVADDAGGARLARLALSVETLLPRNGGERRQVGHQEHVRLRDAGEALDARAVEPFAVLDRLLQLVHRHLYRFHGADDVGELQADEAQVALLGQLEGGVELFGRHGSIGSSARSLGTS
jgi:hypothetical protein